MSLHRLEFFVSVAKLRSFTKAAKECHMAQSAMSQQIHLLEKELGVELFYRNSHMVELTAAGRAYYDDARKIVEENALSVAKMRRIAKGEEGTLTFGICGYEEETVLTDLIKQYHKAKPEVQLQFISNNYEKFEEELKMYQYDLMFVWPYDFLNRTETGYKKVLESETGILMSPDHSLARKTTITKEDLSKQTHVIISSLTNTSLYYHYLHFFDQTEFPEHIFKVPNASILRMMIEMNQGISIVPKGMRGLQNKNLLIKDTPDHSHKIEMGIVYLKENRNSCLKSFLEFIDHCS